MSNLDDNDKLFEEIFGDLFKNPPTKEEIEARKREEELQKQAAIEDKRLYNLYAMTLPGAEKARDDNPIVEIRGGVDEDGNFFQRAITVEEKTEEFLKEMDKLFNLDSLDSKNGSFHK